MFNIIVSCASSVYLWLHIQSLVDVVSVLVIHMWSALTLLASIDPTNSMKSISDVGAPTVQIELSVMITIMITIINRTDLQFNVSSNCIWNEGWGGGGGLTCEQRIQTQF